jgi:hypothetical protein
MGNVNDAAAAQSMRSRQHGQDMDWIEQSTVEPLGDRHQCQMSFAAFKLTMQLSAAAFDQADINARMPEQIFGQEWREHRFHDLWRSTDAERPDPSSLECARSFAKPVDVCQQTTAARKEIFPLGRQQDAPTNPVEQRDAEFGFKGEYLSGGG